MGYVTKLFDPERSLPPRGFSVKLCVATVCGLVASRIQLTLLQVARNASTFNINGKTNAKSTMNDTCQREMLTITVYIFGRQNMKMYTFTS